MLVIIGTLYDLYSEKDIKWKLSEFETNSTCLFVILYIHLFFFFVEFILVAFSFPSNVKRLFYNGTRTTEYSGINFLKIMACLSILFGHRLMYVCGHPLYNPTIAEKVNNSI